MPVDASDDKVHIPPISLIIVNDLRLTFSSSFYFFFARVIFGISQACAVKSVWCLLVLQLAQKTTSKIIAQGRRDETKTTTMQYFRAKVWAGSKKVVQWKREGNCCRRHRCLLRRFCSSDEKANSTAQEEKGEKEEDGWLDLTSFTAIHTFT